MSNIEIERQEESGIVTVILNRPEKLNALDLALWIALGETIAALHEDDGVRCIVLRGAGERAFGPGADISEFPDSRLNAEQAAAYGAHMHRTMGALADCRHPLVAMIHGLCVGGSLEVALVCDLRICGQGSRFGIPVNRLGLVMAYPEIEALIAVVGRSTALEILFEGRIFGAQEAKEKGLVNRVVADGEVEAETMACANRIAAGAPLVNRWHKRFANRIAEGLTPPRPLTPEEEAEGFACFDTEDFQTGYQAFLAKQKPVFKGR